MYQDEREKKPLSKSTLERDMRELKFKRIEKALNDDNDSIKIGFVCKEYGTNSSAYRKWQMARKKAPNEPAL